MIENDSQRRVLVHCMVPRTIGDIARLMGTVDRGVKNLDDGTLLSDTPIGKIREVIQDLEKLGCVKGFYGVNPHALNTITQNDDDVITHEDQETDPDGILADEVAVRNRGEVWADRLNDPRKPGTFQPDATYYLMTQDAFDFLSQKGPDVPPEHEGLEPGPALIGGAS